MNDRLCWPSIFYNWRGWVAAIASFLLGCLAMYYAVGAGWVSP